MRVKGLEPPWITPLDPKSSASTNFATRAIACILYHMSPKLQAFPKTDKMSFVFQKKRSIQSLDAQEAHASK